MGNPAELGSSTSPSTSSPWAGWRCTGPFWRVRHSSRPVEPLTAAVDGLRASGNQDDLPRGLLTRAWLRFLEGDPAGATADLDEAWQIAERGSMKLHMADILLHRARLFRDRAALEAAARLIEETGYHRRDEELADAREALETPAG